MMPSRQSVLDVLRTIDDPEMPISIVDLGLIERIDCERNEVRVLVLPTFIGCPALDMIRDAIKAKLGALPGVANVDVEFVNDPPWSVDRISEPGRASLNAHGVTVPTKSGDCADAQRAASNFGTMVTAVRTSAVPCPFCHSNKTRLESPFGPTRCRMIYYCESCANSFEHMKRV